LVIASGVAAIIPVFGPINKYFGDKSGIGLHVAVVCGVNACREEKRHRILPPVTASAGDVAELLVHGNGLTADMDVISPRGKTICSGDYDTSGFDCTIPATGTYTILVRDDGHTFTGTYRITGQKRRHRIRSSRWLLDLAGLWCQSIQPMGVAILSSAESRPGKVLRRYAYPAGPERAVEVARAIKPEPVSAPAQARVAAVFRGTGTKPTPGPGLCLSSGWPC
jgi:hypothetical protein